jgi:hypothetical protein
MIIYSNYTFSVPDKRLYTLYKGITVTLACLRTAKPPLHAAPLVSASYDAPLHVWRGHVLRRPFDGAKATVRAAPSAPNQPATPPRPHWASETSRLDCLPPHAGRTQRVVLLAHSHLRRRGSPIHTFVAEGLHPSGSPREGAVLAKQRSHNSSSISVIVKSSLHTSAKNPQSPVARSQPPGRTWHNASEGHFPQQ